MLAVRRHNSCKVLEHRVTGTQQVLTYGPRFQPKMGLKKNGKKVRLQLHESVDSQESLEMDEYSDEDDEVFVRHDRDNEEAGKPLIKRRKKVEFKEISLKFCCFILRLFSLESNQPWFST